MTTAGVSLAQSRASWLREGATLAAAFALCLLGGVIQVDDTLAAPPVAAYVVAVASCAVLTLRHRAPVVALAVTTGCAMVAAPVGLLLTPLIATPVAISAYALAVRAERRTTVPLLIASAALLVVSTAVLGDLSWPDVSRLGTVAATPLVAGVLGHSVQNRWAYLAAVKERARRAEETRETEARRRVEEERVRIARELHDLVAHQITLANAQATVAAHLLDTRPEQARTSLHELVETTRNALDDLRATVGLLRRSDDPVASAEPAPGLARLPALLESFARAGLAVSVHHEGADRALPPAVDLTAYRIVQEALTNVAKHAGADAARVRMAWQRDCVAITVTDDGPGRRTTRERAPGYGLIGMQERVAAIGGDLVAGARPEGGFRVTARLPVPPVPSDVSPTPTEVS